MKQYVVVAIVEVEDYDGDDKMVKSIWSQTFSSLDDARACRDWFDQYANVNADCFLKDKDAEATLNV